ncbi:Cobyrinic acid ac-diamide synthase [Methanocaldococcus infernus ME]|uniref:Cobyrinic acid ac-diamide synthase n=1 Tax=Methanocaldococcus infernus (strain DSM 11812 / JCM 15783 / ME) TaxID=573063 RepID=D5VRV8_METIM|nr:P-loop NTPase [Methanocaldococcus infernus]ADG13311.1 Cobyrinic acid ac-diamide synthase [Methanocaldococcus infernus ME]
MKIAIVGKGGVGKTFIASNLIKLFEKNGYRVIAVDCDPNPTLALSFGIEEEIKPLSKREDIINERVVLEGGVYNINPKVDDLIDKIGYRVGNVTLIVMGTIEKSGEGCVCPASTLLRKFLRHLILKEKDVVILDMEAGLEHFGRKTLEGIDLMLIVVEPTKKSIVTAKRMIKLGKELGIKKIGVIVNKVRDKMELELDAEIYGFIPYDEAVLEAELKGEEIKEGKALEAIEEIFKKIISS